MAAEAQTEVRYELDDEGRPSGVEQEEVGDDDAIVEPFDPRLIDVTTEQRSLDTLVKRLAIGRIDLDPDFQRSRGIWTQRKKSQLIESLLLRIPLPTFYVAEIETEGALGEDSWAVVDGIQRLSTIAQFVAPRILDLEPLRLHGLQYLDREEGKGFDQLSQALQLRILESQFTISIIRKSTPEPVKLNIFARINTGGVPLSAQELRHALTPGRARKVLKELAEGDEFRAAVDYSVSPSRMADREMVLRFLAFRIQNAATYREQDFDGFLRSTMAQINKWDLETEDRYRNDFDLAMRVSRRIFGNDAFRKRYQEAEARRPVSKALFEAVAVSVTSVSDDGGKSAVARLTKRAGQVRVGFRNLMTDPEFERSISQGTGDPRRVRYRFEQMNALMRRVAGIQS
jgi:hypothetical protein